MPDIMIDFMRVEDWDTVRAIYMDGIATGNATFEASAPDWEQWDKGHLRPCRLVARSGDEVLGWAALSSVSNRCVYGGVAEASLYVAERARGKGVGRALLAALIEASEAAGIWTLQAGVFPENITSLALLKRGGFRMVGIRERLGSMNGRWRDVALVERRSARVGV